MIIKCPNCNKKFDIDQKLIPSSGRLLQCGSCNHKWFFELNIIKKNTEEEIKIKPKKDFVKNINPPAEELKKETIIEHKIIIPEKKNEKKNINYFNILLVAILSMIAFTLVIDTFQNQLISVFPNIKFLLNNLYQSIEDIKLFTLDLIK